MSVTIFFRTDVRPYSGYQDPGLPIASYIAQGGVAGDASGGLVLMTFRFQNPEGDERVTELYNLEQLSVDTSSGTGRVLFMSTLNMDALSPARPASPQMWKLTTEGEGGISSLTLRSNAGLPLWLGSPNENAPSGNGGLRFTWANNVDLLLYAITIQGYMWGPRAVLAPGGPRRPEGFFRP